MIRSLRRRHWRWMLALAIVLPLLLWAFLGSRDFSDHESVVPESLTEEHREKGTRIP